MALSTEFSTLDKIIRHWSKVQPNKKAITFLKGGCAADSSYTYRELDKEATKISTLLLENNLQGERALLLYNGDNNFITAFLACLYANVIAVPVYKPQRRTQHWQRLERIVSDCSAKVILGESSEFKIAEPWFARSKILSKPTKLETDRYVSDYVGTSLPSKRDEKSIAFLQYTSGSTGAPKGVIVTHRNLFHNEAQLADAFEHNNDTNIVSWLPLFHDMGLIGNLLQCLYIGGSYYYMTPINFLQKPARWLQAISKYRADTSGAPNFAYDLCTATARTTPKVFEKIDLSSWSLAFNGAEPIRASTLRRFSKAFKRCGFDKRAFYPCYGLAEGTLFTSGGKKRLLPVSKNFKNHFLQINSVQESEVLEESTELVSLGKAFGNQEIIIVDPDSGVRVAGNKIGEIWLKGESVAKGYWQCPQLSKEIFENYITAEDGGLKGPYLKTGDLGFICEGELYFTGRIKELIIIRGRNYYPQDIEQAIQTEVPQLRLGCGAACSIENQGEESLIIVQELKRDIGGNVVDTAQVVKYIKQCISAEFNISVADVVLLKPGLLPKTSSGKIQRNKCAQMYLQGEWKSIALNEPLDSTVLKGNKETIKKEVLQTIVNEICNLTGDAFENIDIEKPLFAYGLDSLQIIKIQRSIEEKHFLTIEYEALLSDESIEKTSQQTKPVAAERHEFSNFVDNKQSELSINQRSLWFLSKLDPDSRAYNLPFAFRVPEATSAEKVAATLQTVLDNQTVSRVHLKEQQGSLPTLQLSEHSICEVELIDASSWGTLTVEKYLLNFGQSKLPLANSSGLIKAIVLAQTKSPVVAVVTHHIISDLWSQALLVKEIISGLKGYFTAKQDTWSYFSFIKKQQHYLESEQAKADWQYWREKLAGDLPVLSLPSEKKPIQKEQSEAGSIDFSLSKELTFSIKEAARLCNTTINTILLSGYVLFLHRLSRQNDFLIGLPTVGDRSGVFSECHGYFINPVALRSTLTGNITTRKFIDQVRKGLTESIEHSNYPIQRIIEKLNPVRSTGIATLFNVMFSYNTTPALSSAGSLILGHGQTKLTIDDTCIETIHTPVPGAQVDLSLILSDSSEDTINARMVYRSGLFQDSTIKAWCESYLVLLKNITGNFDSKVLSLPLLDQPSIDKLTDRWTGEKTNIDRTWNLPSAFAKKTSELEKMPAISCGELSLTYNDVETKSNQFARYLLEKGVKKGARVGVHMHKSPRTIVVLLAIMKAGAAYVPLDPEYPIERLKLISRDAKLDLIVDDFLGEDLRSSLEVTFILSRIIDEGIDSYSSRPLDLVLEGMDLAYMIYTSGSTGVPKGVPISHSNLCNLFLSLDKKITREPKSRFLSVTSISFDISVLEIFWSLTRGVEVVLPPKNTGNQNSGLKLSIMYFSSNSSVDSNIESPYKLLIDGVKTAERLGFDSVWVPERHFHSFGGIFPNPSVVAAAVAAATEKIHIRAGSVVLPLHHPARVAEEWAVVDALSNGRAGIAFASGWHPNDFIFSPESYVERKALLKEKIEQVQALWRGESLEFNNGIGKCTTISTLPRPVQKHLPTWITAAGSEQTFIQAGQLGANVLTHMLGQNIQELETKIAIYKNARKEAGFDPDGGCITIMLHTYVCEDESLAKERVEEPFKNYLRSSVELMRPIAESLGLDPEKNKELLVQNAFERYYSTSALFGTPECCEPLLERLQSIGVTEVACLIDFGIPVDLVVESLTPLSRLMQKRTDINTRLAQELTAIESLQNITHLQCTPGYAKLLLSTSQGIEFLRNLDILMLGGEAVPGSLVSRLHEIGCTNILNMYGPTETTVWSAVEEVANNLAGGYAQIDGPLANTGFYVVDENLNLLPPGFTGELCIAGLGLSEGYWQQPEKTAKAFIDNPFEKNDCGKMYLTGDLVRQAFHGGLTFISRKDEQCKVRGHRVELGEIEHYLQEIPSVDQAAVCMVSEEANSSLLCALVVAKEQKNEEQLKICLRRQLPEFMVPAKIEFVEALPKTPNGKLDRKSLGKMLSRQEVLAQSVGDPVPANNELERQLLTIWSRFTTVEQLGIQANFFESGGHSLMLPQVQLAIKKEVNKTVGIVDLLQYPTIQSLAHFLSGGSEKSLESLKQSEANRAGKKKASFQRQRKRKKELVDV